MDVVLKLREVRRLRRLSQKDAAEKSGVGEKTISSFETGERITGLRVVQLLALLNAYDMTPAEFFGNGVEQALFGELERLTAQELRLMTAVRRLPDSVASRLNEKFLTMIDAAEVVYELRLRAAV